MQQQVTRDLGSGTSPRTVSMFFLIKALYSYSDIVVECSVTNLYVGMNVVSRMYR